MLCASRRVVRFKTGAFSQIYPTSRTTWACPIAFAQNTTILKFTQSGTLSSIRNPLGSVGVPALAPKKSTCQRRPSPKWVKHGFGWLSITIIHFQHTPNQTVTTYQIQISPLLASRSISRGGAPCIDLYRFTIPANYTFGINNTQSHRLIHDILLCTTSFVSQTCTASREIDHRG